MLDLAKRAVATKHFRWMPGMRLSCPTRGYGRIIALTPGLLIEWEQGYHRKTWALEQARLELLPDLNDPATLGCFLALVRKAWRRPHAAAAMGGFGWNVYPFVTNGVIGDEPAITGRYGDGYATEAGAIVSLLEEAP